MSAEQRTTNLLLLGVIAAITWLGLSVRRQFRHHDRDLRAELEQVNRNFEELLG